MHGAVRGGQWGYFEGTGAGGTYSDSGTWHQNGANLPSIGDSAASWG